MGGEDFDFLSLRFRNQHNRLKTLLALPLVANLNYIKELFYVSAAADAWEGKSCVYLDKLIRCVNDK